MYLAIAQRSWWAFLSDSEASLGSRQEAASTLIPAVKRPELCGPVEAGTSLCSEAVSSGGFICLPLLDGEMGCRALESG